MREDIREGKRNYLALQGGYCLEIGVSIIHCHFESFLLLFIVIVNKKN
jgi:hypothetical protein